MDIAWTLFTPWHSLAGGALIGLAASLLLLGNGQIAGISGILGNLLKPEGRAPWRLAFLAGLEVIFLLSFVMSSSFFFLKVAQCCDLHFEHGGERYSVQASWSLFVVSV